MAAGFVNKYVQEFGAFADISKEIGLKESEGTRGQLRKAVHELEESLGNINKRLAMDTEDALSASRTVNIILTIILSLLIAGVIIFIARQVVTAIEFLSHSFNYIRSSEDLSKRVQILRDDEIGSASKDFNILIEYFHDMVGKIATAITKLESATAIVSQSVHNTQSSVEELAENDIKILNPQLITGSELNLEISDHHGAVITLSDIEGNVIQSLRADKKQVSIDVSNLTTGVYFINISISIN